MEVHYDNMEQYHIIFDPDTGRKVNIFSHAGEAIIQRYLMELREPLNEGQDCTKTTFPMQNVRMSPEWKRGYKYYYTQFYDQKPYVYYIHSKLKKIVIYKVPNKLKVSNVTNSISEYTELVGRYKFKHCWTAKSPLPDSIFYHGKQGRPNMYTQKPTFSGAAILFETPCPACTYMFVGHNVRTFRSLGPIVDFSCPLLNKCPYPVACDDNRNFYLFNAGDIITFKATVDVSKLCTQPLHFYILYFQEEATFKHTGFSKILENIQPIDYLE